MPLAAFVFSHLLSPSHTVYRVARRYMLIASLQFVLVTGAVGFLTTWWFVNKIFAAVKVD